MNPTDHPWLRRQDWAVGRVASNTRASLRAAWLGTILWNLVSTPLLFVIPREIERKPIATLAYLFPIIGVGLLVWAVHLTLRWRRFGASTFEMTPMPASPGGVCAGTIHTRLDRGSGPPVVSVRLTCLQRTVSRSSKERNVRENIVWREEYELSADRIAFTPDSIPVHFALPSDALETTTIDQSPGVFWALGAEAELPGVDLREDFDVPVYRTGDVTMSAAPSFASAAAAPEPITIERLARAGIEIRQTPDGTEYCFRPGRNVSFASGVVAFLFLWTGALWLQWYLGVPSFFIAVTGLFELVMLLVVADLWFGSTTVIVSSGVVRRRHTLFGIGGWRTIPVSNISTLQLHISMQSTGRRGTPYYELRATLKGGRRCALGDGIRNKRHAEWLLARIRQESGLAHG